MFSIAGLLDRAKLRAGIESDYRLAKVIGAKHESISQYRHGKALPAEEITAGLCALSGDDPDETCARIQAQRSRNEAARALWLRVADKLSSRSTAAILSVLFTTYLIAGNPLPAQAAEPPITHQDVINHLYIVFSAFLSVSLLGCFYPPPLHVETRTYIHNHGSALGTIP